MINMQANLFLQGNSIPPPTDKAGGAPSGDAGIIGSYAISR